MFRILLNSCILIYCTTLFSQNNLISKDIKVNSFIYGTLLQPTETRENLAIIIAGSGPTDRDGNQQMMKNNSLKMLSQDLAKEGIATFRYDKRIIPLMKENALVEEKLNFNDFVTDAVSIIDFFKNNSSFKNIYLIGHSQGSLVGILAAQKSKVQGFISLAGAGQGIDHTIVNQIALQMPGLKEETEAAFKTLKEKGKVDDFNPALTSILRPSVQPFMASWMQYNPSEELSKLQIPVLIINGTNDLQVSLSEAKSLSTSKPDATLSIIDGMNHVLKTVGSDTMENAKSYNEPSKPLNQELVPEIISFLQI